MNPDARNLMSGTAIVPAAGRGERFGGAKLLANVDGAPVLDRTLGCLLDAGLGLVVVVTAPDADFGAVERLSHPRVRRAINLEPARGMFSSILVGLAEAGDAEGPLLVLPADMPFVRAETVARVLALCAQRRAVVVPVFEGRRGHPVAIPVAVRETLGHADPQSSLKGVLEASGVSRVDLDVDDPGVLYDVDLPADLARRPPR